MTTRLRLSREGDHFLVDDPKLIGSPPVGRGRTIMEAYGSWLFHNQDTMDVRFETDPSAHPAVNAFYRRQLAER